MTAAEFRAQIERIQARWSTAKYDTEFCRLLWPDVAALPDGLLTRAVDRLVGELPRVVTKTMIVETCLQLRASMPRTSTTVIEPRECEACDGAGLLAMLDIESRRFFASCPKCANGETQRKLGMKPPNALQMCRLNCWPERKSFDAVYERLAGHTRTGARPHFTEVADATT